MRCLLVKTCYPMLHLLIILIAHCFVHDVVEGNEATLFGAEQSSALADNANTNMFNRMVCENEKLQISCTNPDHVIRIERAYYGRYSITPCNKNHLKYTKGCTANDTLIVIKKLCQGRNNCNHKITTSLFKRDPCPGVDKVLEVNYICYPKHFAYSKAKFLPIKETTKFYETTSLIEPPFNSIELFSQTFTNDFMDASSASSISSSTPSTTTLTTTTSIPTTPTTKSTTSSTTSETTSSTTTSTKTSTTTSKTTKTKTTTKRTSTTTSTTSTTSRRVVSTRKQTSPMSTTTTTKRTTENFFVDESSKTLGALSTQKFRQKISNNDIDESDADNIELEDDDDEQNDDEMEDESDTANSLNFMFDLKQHVKNKQNQKVRCQLQINRHESYNALENNVIHTKCLNGDDYVGSNTYKCKSNGKFELINSTCMNSRTKWIDQLNLDLVNKKNPITLIERLNSDLLSDDENLLLKNNSLNSVVNFIRNASDLFFEYKAELKINTLNVSDALFKVIDTLIGKNADWKMLPSTERSTSLTKLFDTVDTIVFDGATLLSNRYDYTRVEENPNYFQTFDLMIINDNILGEMVSNDELKNEITFPKNDYLKTDERAILNIESPTDNQKFMFLVYKNVEELMLTDDRNISRQNRIDEFLRPNNDEEENKSIKELSLINSNVISFKMNDKYEIANLRHVPIMLVFKHLRTDFHDLDDVSIETKCSYWNYNKNNFVGNWSQNGCRLETTNKTHTICKCDHLTHFAVIMDIRNVHFDTPKIHRIILTSITVGLSSLSCICIIFTLIAFRFVKVIKKNREKSMTKDLTVITTHLCVCLLASLLVFLLGILVQHLKLKTFCSIIAIMSHYLFLCAFFWMLLEGVQLYLMLVRIFILEKSPISKFCLIAYGLPFVIVLTSKLYDYIKLDSRGYGTSYHCWISAYQHFNLSFIIPVSCILLANLIILVIVIYGMRTSISSKKIQLNRNNKKKDEFFKSLLGFWCLILTLLGLPWILGYLVIDNKKTLIFSYLFTILNSSQGTVVFIFHCLLSKSVREELIKGLRKQKRRLLISLGVSKSKSDSLSPATNSGKLSPNCQQNKLTGSSKILLLKRGPSNTSSINNFRLPMKKYESARLLSSKNKNKSQTIRSLPLSSEEDERSASTANQRNNRQEKFWFLRYFFNILACFCFKSSDSISSSSLTTSYSTTIDSNKAKNQNSLGPSASPIIIAMTPSSTSSRHLNNSIKNNNYSITTLDNSGKPNRFYITSSTKFNGKPQMYYNTNEGNNSYSNNQSLVGNYIQIPLVNSTLVKHSNSLLSTINKHQAHTPPTNPITSLLDSINNGSNIKANESATNQIPSSPPPLPPPLAYNNDLTSNGFSTFKSSQIKSFKSLANSNNLIVKNEPSKPSILPQSQSTTIKRYGNYDENQYLTPEYHSYSVVDHNNCGNSNCHEVYNSYMHFYEQNLGVNNSNEDDEDDENLEDDLSNNYVEVIDEFIDDANNQSISSNNDMTNKTANKQRFNFSIDAKKSYKYLSVNSRSSQNNASSTSNKLKDLITMPEEFDAIDKTSNVSEQDLFKMTSNNTNINTGNKQVRLISKGLMANTKQPATVSSSSSSSSPPHSLSTSSTTGLDSSMENAVNGTASVTDSKSTKTNTAIVTPNDNLKAKKYLQRI